MVKFFLFYSNRTVINSLIKFRLIFIQTKKRVSYTQRRSTTPCHLVRDWRRRKRKKKKTPNFPLRVSFAALSFFFFRASARPPPSRRNTSPFRPSSRAGSSRWQGSGLVRFFNPLPRLFLSLSPPLSLTLSLALSLSLIRSRYHTHSTRIRASPFAPSFSARFFPPRGGGGGGAQLPRRKRRSGTLERALTRFHSYRRTLVSRI